MTRRCAAIAVFSLLGCRREDTRVCPDPVAAASANTAVAAPVRTIDLPLPKAIAFGDQETVMVVTIEASGRTSVDRVVVTDDKAITDAAQRARSRDPEVKAVLMADPSITHGRVITVVDRIRMGGIARLAFAVAAPAPTPMHAP